MILTNTICPVCRFTKYGTEKHSWKPILHAPTIFVTIPSTSDTPTSPFKFPISLTTPSTRKLILDAVSTQRRLLRMSTVSHRQAIQMRFIILTSPIDPTYLFIICRYLSTRPVFLLTEKYKPIVYLYLFFCLYLLVLSL